MAKEMSMANLVLSSSAGQNDRGIREL